MGIYLLWLKTDCKIYEIILVWQKGDMIVKRYISFCLLWQEQYKEKILCKLTDIQKAESFSVLDYSGLYLKLHSLKKVPAFFISSLHD